MNDSVLRHPLLRLCIVAALLLTLFCRGWCAAPAVHHACPTMMGMMTTLHAPMPMDASMPDHHPVQLGVQPLPLLSAVGLAAAVFMLFSLMFNAGILPPAPVLRRGRPPMRLLSMRTQQ